MVQNASSYHCFCFCRSLAGDRCTAGEHGPDGKPCAICTLRSLRWIQHWSVADLAVPLLPTLFFCVVPVSADFVAQLLGLLIYHQRRRQIPFSRSKDQPLSALKAVAFYNLQFRCFFHAFSDHPDGAPLMLAVTDPPS